MKTKALILFSIILNAATGIVNAQPTYPHHDCDSICDLPCQDRIEQVHQGENGLLPLNCTNGAPGTGPVANYCDWFWNAKTWTVQTCGNGGINGNQTGCQAGGTLKCRKANGLLVYPEYDFQCHFNSQKGGMPVQSVDRTGGVCTWPDGSGVFMQCGDNGGIVFGTSWQSGRKESLK